MCGPGTISERTSANRERQDDIKLLKAKHAYDLAKTENDRCRAAQNARQRVQVKRLEDGLPVYGPDEGPELLGAEE